MERMGREWERCHCVALLGEFVASGMEEMPPTAHAYRQAAVSVPPSGPAWSVEIDEKYC